MESTIGEKPAVLITDDDADFRETMRDALEPRGFQTVLAADGSEALSIVRREPVHVMLLDMHMPGLDGLETVRHVKELKLAIPCILISAKLDDVLAEQARRADVFSSLAKPVRFREVFDTVQAALRDVYGWH